MLFSFAALYACLYLVINASASAILVAFVLSLSMSCSLNAALTPSILSINSDFGSILALYWKFTPYCFSWSVQSLAVCSSSLKFSSRLFPPVSIMMWSAPSTADLRNLFCEFAGSKLNACNAKYSWFALVFSSAVFVCGSNNFVSSFSFKLR